jgi:hypothetical protein
MSDRQQRREDRATSLRATILRVPVDPAAVGLSCSAERCNAASHQRTDAVLLRDRFCRGAVLPGRARVHWLRNHGISSERSGDSICHSFSLAIIFDALDQRPTNGFLTRGWVFVKSINAHSQRCSSSRMSDNLMCLPESPNCFQINIGLENTFLRNVHSERPE